VARVSGGHVTRSLLRGFVRAVSIAQELESAIPFPIPASANLDSCPHAASFLWKPKSSLLATDEVLLLAAHAHLCARPLGACSASSPPTR
jgi:hypothetical protein